jgi:hypothetical protein
MKADQPVRLSSGARGGQRQGILFRAHASALRPFIAKMPCGRFWMKMMMNTSTGDLGQHRAGPAFEQLVQDAQAQRRVHRAGQLAHAAQHHHHEASTM